MTAELETWSVLTMLVEDSEREKVKDEVGRAGLSQF